MADENKVMVAVMGLTGVGKSSLIRTATGNSSILVEDSLDSGTQEIESYDVTIDGTAYVLVDTPGFDDKSQLDAIIVDKLLRWLEATFREGKQLSGIIYLHRISEPRMQGSALRNMRMFRKLCGPDCFKNVVLATTFWKDVSKAVGLEREKELKEKDEFWGQMVKKGSKVERLGQDKDSVLKILKMVGQRDKIVLQAQDELVRQHKSRDKTSAALLVGQEARRLEEERQRRIAEAKAKAIQEFANRERERKRQAERERSSLQAEMRAQERINRERKEQQEREAKELLEVKRKAREEAAQKERDRVAQEKARIAAKKKEQERQQRMAELAAAARRREYYQNFRCAGITPHGKCDKCGDRLSRWKYYFHCCHCFSTDNYWHCGPCGGNCGKAEHPWMKKGVTDDCIVM